MKWQFFSVALTGLLCALVVQPNERQGAAIFIVVMAEWLVLLFISNALALARGGK